MEADAQNFSTTFSELEGLGTTALCRMPRVEQRMYMVTINVSVSDTSEGQQVAQLQILNKAQQRQMEDLEQKLEDSRRNTRYLEHQFAIVKGHFYIWAVLDHTISLI